jgi:hypothetical protein
LDQSSHVFGAAEAGLADDTGLANHNKNASYGVMRQPAGGREAKSLTVCNLTAALATALWLSQ